MRDARAFVADLTNALRVAVRPMVEPLDADPDATTDQAESIEHLLEDAGRRPPAGSTIRRKQ